MLFTCYQATVDFLRGKGFKAELCYSADGVDMWMVDVPEHDEIAADIEFQKLLQREKFEWGLEVAKKRLASPIYSACVNGIPAYAMSRAEILSVPLSRTPELLSNALRDPSEQEKTPEIMELPQDTLKALLLEAKKDGVKQIIYYGAPHFTEIIDIAVACKVV